MVATVKCDTITEASNTGTANLSLSSTGNVTIGNNLTVNGTTTQTGSTTFTGPTYFPNGSVSAPSIAHTGDTNCGLYFGTDIIYAATAGTNALTIDASQNMTVANTLVMGSSFKRNRLINGNFAVDQRNAGAAQNITASQVYCLDRWVTLGTVTNGTVQRVTGDSQQQYAIRILRGSGTSTGYGAIFQTIETINCYDLAGKTISISFRAQKGSAYSAAATPTLTVVTGSGTDQGSAGVTSGSWTNYAATSPTLSGTLTTSFSTFTATASIPAGTNEIALYFSTGAFSGTGSSNDYIDITGVQLEVGSVATPYERQIYSDQLAQCQRYYQRLAYVTAVAPSSTTVNCWSLLPVVMRTSPTIGQTGVLNFQGDGGNNATQSATGLGNTFSGTYWMACNNIPNFTGLSTLRPNSLAVDGNNGNVFTLSAEL